MYAIRHKETGELMRGGMGRSFPIFPTKGGARTTFTSIHSHRTTPFGELNSRLQDSETAELVKMALVPEAELESLRKDAAWLSCLEDAGVDNWQGIGFAYDLRAEQELEDDE